MTRARAFKTQALTRIWEELRFTPPQTLARMAADAEEFAAQIAPMNAYPEDLVVARITRYRPEGVRVGDVVVGSALIADLVRFVGLASARAPCDPAGRGGALTLADAAAHLGVSRATLRRYRHRGLMCHHVRRPSEPGHAARSELCVYREVLEAFARHHAGLVRRARATGRLAGDERAQLADRAVARLARGACTVQALAEELAAQTGRSARTIRRVIEHDARVGAQAARVATRTVSERDALRAARAWHQGTSPQALAAHGGASVAAWTRAVSRGRALLLAQAVAHTHPLELANFARDDSAATLLAPRAVRAGLPAGAWHLPVPRLDSGRAGASQALHAAHPVDTAQVVAHHFLLWRAARTVGATKRPAPGDLDAAERDLRWAYRLRRAVVERALPDALARVAQHLGVPWAQLPAELQWKWAAAVAATMAQALDFRALASVSVDDVHPLRAVALAVERMLSRADSEDTIRRTPGWLGASVVAPWVVHIATGDRWSPWLERAAPPHARIVARRFGLDGEPPATIEELAPLLPGSAAAAQGRLYAALAALRGAARRGA